MKEKRTVKKMVGIFAAASGSFAAALGAKNLIEADARETTTVKMTLWTPYCSEEEFDHVLEKINERLSDELQLRLDINMIASGNEALMKYLMENPDADIIYTGNFQEAVDQNLMMPLDDLLEAYGQDILSILPEEYLSYGRRDGKQYGLPRNIEIAAANGVVMRTDLLEKYEIDADTIQTWDDVGDVLEKITEGEEELYGMIPNLPVEIPSVEAAIGTVIEGENGLEAVNYFETDDFWEWAQRIYSWGQSGCLYQSDNYRYSSGTTRSLLYQLMEEGRLFSYMVGYKPGIADQESKNFGRELTKIQIGRQVITNFSSFESEWGIYSGSAHPEEAMKILNFLYEDKEINNLFCWGIEGEHYEKREDGMLIPPDQEPEIPYFFNRNWQLPNGYMADAWAGDIPNLLEQVEAFNAEAEYAADFGFWFDDSKVQVEMEQCVEVVNAYLDGFICGRFDPEEMIPIMNSELEDCGIGEVIEEKQRQLSQWEAERTAERDG